LIDFEDFRKVITTENFKETDIDENVLVDMNLFEPKDAYLRMFDESPQNFNEML
jgi:hypothetical protein